MKHFSTLFLSLCAATSSYAGTIFSTVTDIDWSVGGYVQLGSELFAELEVADKIVFDITYVDGQDWPQIALYDGSWSTVLSNTSISASTSQVTFYATTSMVQALQSLGAVVTGCGYTLNSVEIVEAESDEDMSAAIWIGQTVIPSDWSGYVQLSAACFASAEVGNLLRIHYTDIGAGASLSLRNSSWSTLADTEYETPSGSYTRYEITEDMLSELQSGGLIITGVSYTLTWVDIIDETQLPVLSSSVSVTNNWVYEGVKPYINVKITNGTNDAVEATVKLTITTDKYEAYTTLSTTTTAEAGKVTTVPFEFEAEAGFYVCTALVDDELAGSMVIGVEPEQIVSAPDMQSDFVSFWQTAKDELATVELNATLTLLTNYSTSARNVYQVEFYSIPDTKGGEPVAVRGYYAEPTTEGKYPVILHYQGYDSGDYDAYCPSGDDLKDYCELVVCTRGQLINNREPYTNTYDDWFQYNFGDKDTYYYRGAYMDVVRAIDFVCSRDKVDTDNIFAEGQSQGGAFTYAAAALSDHKLNAVAPAIPFMGDFPDYFQIASWPTYQANLQKTSLGMTDDEMYEFLSYFDTKNLATLVTTPVISCIGLQDNVCPPHTNIAPYNNLASDIDKEIHYNPQLAHATSSSWYNTYMAFFAKYLTSTNIKDNKTSSSCSDAAVYNLAGQRVTANYKGLVISAGKKYLQK